MDKIISEELERMKLLSNYDNSKTLSEQLLNNPANKFNVLPTSATAQQVKTVTPAPAQVVKKPAPVPTPLQLKDAKGVRTFQDWLDTNAKGWATGYKDGVINKGQNGGGYGSYGPRTQKAWLKYKDQYLNNVTPQTIQPKTNTLPVQTQGAQQTQASAQQQVNVTSGQAPAQGEEIELQGNPKSSFTR